MYVTHVLIYLHFALPGYLCVGHCVLFDVCNLKFYILLSVCETHTHVPGT